MVEIVAKLHPNTLANLREEVSIDVPDGTTEEQFLAMLQELESGLPENVIQRQNQQMLEQFSHCLNALQSMVSNLQQSFSNSQQYLGTIIAGNKVDFAPLLRQNDEIIGQTAKAIYEVKQAVSKIDVRIPKQPRPTCFKVVRKFDSITNLPLIDRVDCEYSD